MGLFKQRDKGIRAGDRVIDHLYECKGVVSQIDDRHGPRRVLIVDDRGVHYWRRASEVEHLPLLPNLAEKLATKLTVYRSSTTNQ